MKKAIFPALLLACLGLCSCNDTRIADMDGLVWRDEYFGIEATSKQLQESHGANHDPSVTDYYPKITIEGKAYSCTVGLANSYFSVALYDKDSNEEISFYGGKVDGQYEEFISGHYSYDGLGKTDSKEYAYYLAIDLLQDGQYYDYCSANSVKFPDSIILYGYEQ